MQTIDDPQLFITDVLANHARHTPHKPAVVCAEVTRSWQQFDCNINRVANQLLSRGLQKGDKVALLMGNSVEMLEVLFGIVRAGGCVVPLSGLLTADQLAVLIDDCDATWGFASDEFQVRLDSVRGQLDKIANAQWVSYGFAATGESEQRWMPLEQFLEGASDQRPAVSLSMTDDFNIIYSSGTTGLPKGIVQTHRARQHWAFSNAIEMGFNADSRALTTTALYSNGTWLMMLPVLFAGGTLHVMPAFDPAAFLESVQQQQITHTFMVPAQYIMVLEQPQLNTADLSSLKTVLSAGSPLRRDTKQQIIERISSGLYELYGFSEGFATMLKPQQHTEKFASVGTPVLGFEMRILDDAGNECAAGEAGEIAGYGAGLMKEYYKRPQQTAELIWRDPLGRTFLRSGDIGSVDDDGFLHLLDRKKDMIISGGLNVFPSDVEEIVGKHPAVSDVTVIGIPHDKWGESCLALVIPVADSDATEAQIIEWSNQNLARHQRLHALEFREEFPRNALGKVLKRLLREPYWE